MVVHGVLVSVRPSQRLALGLFLDRRSPLAALGALDAQVKEERAQQAQVLRKPQLIGCEQLRILAWTCCKASLAITGRLPCFMLMTGK